MFIQAFISFFSQMSCSMLTDKSKSKKADLRDTSHVHNQFEKMKAITVMLFTLERDE